MKEQKTESAAGLKEQYVGENILGEISDATKRAYQVYDSMGEPFDAVDKMGKFLAQSGMLGVKTIEQGKVVALTCILEGITPIEFARTYDLIDGKPSKKAAAMLAEFQRRGGRILYHERTGEVVSATATHPLYPDGLSLRVTYAELDQAGVTMGKNGIKANYMRHPRQMLSARVVAELIRAIDPTINAGLYASEEFDEDPASAPEQPQNPPKPQEAPKAQPLAELRVEKRSVADRAKKAIAAFSKIGEPHPTREDLEKYVGEFNGAKTAPLASWTSEDVDQLLVVYTGINTAGDHWIDAMLEAFPWMAGEPEGDEDPGEPPEEEREPGQGQG